MAALWGGRFCKRMHPWLAAFSESLSFDRELAAADIRASMAHARMLAQVGLISSRDLAAILRGLNAIARDLRAGRFVFRPENEDIHMAIEADLTRRIGKPGQRLHTARSRNDQVATDLRLWAREKIDTLCLLIHRLQRALVQRASRCLDIIVPGYTHLQRGQPISLAHHLLAYVEMLERDRERLVDARRRLNRLPLGAGALAGTTLPIDREAVRRALGFDELCANSLDAVSDRDFVVETVACLAILFAHLSRFAEDIILWASAEWGLLRLDDAWSTGSSIMPQKRNPDLLELIRGKSGRIFGHLMALLTVLKGLPLAYNRDLQEDKEPIFDAVRTAEAALRCLAAFVPTMRFSRPRAAALLREGFLEATAIAEYLVAKGMPFRKAHEVVGKLVREAEAKGSRLSDLSLKTLRQVSPLFAADALRLFSPEEVAKSYRSAGNAGPHEARRAVARWQKKLALRRSRL